jgi:hypothetical protein
MQIGIIIECSDIYNIKLVKTIYSDHPFKLKDQFTELIFQHLRSIPEVIENEDDFKVIPGLAGVSDLNFPELPMHKNLCSFTTYIDRYGKWRLIIL